MQDYNQEKQVEFNTPNSREKFENSETGIEPTPNNPPWNSGIAFLLWLASVALIMLLPALFVVPYLAKSNVKAPSNAEAQKLILSDPRAAALFLGGTILAHIVTIILAWFVVTKFNKYSFTKMIGWRWGGFKAWHGVLILIGIYAVALTLNSILGSQENDLTRLLQSSRTAALMIAFLATVTAPLVEEVVYRGVLYSAFQRTFNPVIAVIIVTVIFAGVHVPQYLPDYGTIISICLLSLIITLIRVKTDNLLPCIAFHMAFNGIQSIFIILGPYLPLPESLNPTPEKVSMIIHFLTSIFRVC